MRKITFKRIAILLFFFSLPCGFLPAEAEGTAGNDTSNTNSENKQYYRGDVNMDGKISLADVATLVAHLRGVKFVLFQKETADADNSGTVDQDDVRQIISWILTGTNGGKVIIVDDGDHTSGTTPSMPWG